MSDLNCPDCGTPHLGPCFDREAEENRCDFCGEYWHNCHCHDKEPIPMSNYSLVYRTLDNSDGIYAADGHQVVSLCKLEHRGYSLHYLLSLTPERLAKIAEKEQSR